MFMYSYWFIIDIDECNDFNKECAQDCTNINGSYTCSCGTGYVLSNDGHNCTGILSINIIQLVYYY